MDKPVNEEIDLKLQFPPDTKLTAYDSRFYHDEPLPTDYRAPKIAVRLSVKNYDEVEANERARQLMGDEYEEADYFRTGRFWVFYTRQ